MKELSCILKALDQARDAGLACALATVVEVAGSAYRRPGARMLITEDGQTTGGVSGGCLERDVVIRARKAMLSGETSLATYDTTDDDDIEFGVGLGCRGVVRLLVEPLPGPDQPCHLSLLREPLRRREPAVLATVWRTDGSLETRPGARMMLGDLAHTWCNIADADLASQIEVDSRSVLQDGRSLSRTYQLSHGQADVFLEYLKPATPLVLFGGGPDAIPLVRMAGELGWHVTVVDSRPSAASRARFPQVDALHLCRPEHVREQVALGSDTVAVIMTHNYLTDLRLLQELLPSPARYLGLLGPKSRSERLLGDLAEAGVRPTAAQLERLHAPVGLDLGAENAEEIALSVLAEIKATLAGRRGGMLRDRATPMHERARIEPCSERSAPAEPFVCALSAS